MSYKPYVTYTQELPGTASMLMKRVAEKNAVLMRSRTIKEHREAIALLADVRPSSPFTVMEGIMCAGVPCEWIYMKNNCRKGKVILYFHGGSWIFGSIKAARPFAMYLAECVGCRVLVVDYRLAPEYPYPAGLDDCFAVYRWLLANGYKAKDIAIMGDSAGGNLGLCLLNRLKLLGYEQPACLCAASPVTDLRDGCELVSSGIDLIYTIHEGEERDIFSVYLNGNGREDPLVSPVTANLSGIAPVLIHTGEDEPIARDNIAYADKAADAGAEASVVIFKDMFHDFSVVGRTLKESRQSVAGFKAFLEQYLFG